MSQAVTGLPSNGSTVHVRLEYDIDGTWIPLNYTYTAFTTPPPPGSGGGGPHAVKVAGAFIYNYDANGNITSGAGRVIAYDFENRPTSITKGGN